jgi:large subunit ribosomal protein L18
VSLQRKIRERTKRRTLRVREKVRGTGVPRLSVFRSLNHIYAQIIDDQQHKTLVSYSSLELEAKSGEKKEVALNVGKELAKRALQAGISKVIFDRGPFLYHGRIQSLAEGARQAGLEI